MVTAAGLVCPGRSGAVRGWGCEAAGQPQTSLLAGLLSSFSSSPHRAPPGPRGSPGWTTLVQHPRSLDFTSLAVRPPQTRPLPPPTPPARQHHPGSPRLLTLPLGKARAGARIPRLAEGPARCPGALGDPGVSWSPLGLHLQPASVTAQLAESGASSDWQTSAGP